MTSTCCRASLRFICAIALVLGCSRAPDAETIDVSPAAGALYEHATVGGDEEGARIVRQPEHSAVSEIR